MKEVILTFIDKSSDDIFLEIDTVTDKMNYRSVDSVVVYSGSILNFRSDARINQLWIPYPASYFWDKKAFRLYIELGIIIERLLENDRPLDFYKTALVELSKTNPAEDFLVQLVKDEFYSIIWHSLYCRFSDDPLANPDNLFDCLIKTDTRMFVDLVNSGFKNSIPEIASLKDSIVALGFSKDEIVLAAFEDLDTPVKPFLDLSLCHEDFQNLLFRTLPKNNSAA